MKVLENQQETNYLVTRQPIIEEGVGILGYEICSKNSISHDADSDSKMLFNLLSTVGTEKIAQNGLIFLNTEVNSLGKAYNNLVTNEKIIMELHHDDCVDPEKIEEIAEILNTLQQQGYRFAGNQKTLKPIYQSWIKFIEFIKVPMTDDFEQIKKIVQVCKLKNKIVIAERVETENQNLDLLKIGVKYFQGYYYCKPKMVATKIVSPSTERIIRLMKLTTKNSNIEELEVVFKEDPNLSFRLLKYLNSVGVGGMREINSLKFALNFLGYKNLFKWLTVLLSMSNRDKSSGNALTKTMLIREKFMEELASYYLGEEKSETCFLVGIFSLLGAMLNMSTDDVINSVTLPESVKNTLLKQEGEFYDILSFAIALEENNWIEILGLAKNSNISEEVANDKYMKAVDWTEQLTLS